MKVSEAPTEELRDNSPVKSSEDSPSKESDTSLAQSHLVRVVYHLCNQRIGLLKR